MSEVKDPAIKLFGKTISLPPPQDVDVSNSVTTPSQDIKNTSRVELRGAKQEDESTTIPIAEESVEAVTSSVISEDMKKDEASESSESQEKTLKKPDKILPCPRCNSMDTKFCYYNNYNVNQPRHFCKNCQRYWTAGGIMRNVPVGSGRRKNKSCAANYRHIVVSEALHANGSVAPLCDSMTNSQNCVPNGGRDTGNEECIERGRDNSMWKNIHGFPPPQVPCFNPCSFPVSFYPAAPYWHWNVPWISPSSSSAQCSSPMSQTLGKHSREEPLGKRDNTMTGVLIPKALRIDDSNEAARSSIWSTLGIKNEKTDSPAGASLLKAFSSKADDKNRVAHHSWLMKANPAAFSRSLNFHEST